MIRRVALLFAAFFCSLVSAHGQTKPRVVHIFVALADNEHQGIVPVPKALGNGDDPSRNLYWGAAYGVRTFFKRDPQWKEILFFKNPTSAILERSIFQNNGDGTLLVADAYQGKAIQQAVSDFFRAAAGITDKDAQVSGVVAGVVFQVPAVADLVAYVGHDGLMDFALTVDFSGRAETSRPAIVLACASRSFFKDLLRQSGAEPLLWTNGLMAPEAYTLKAAVEAWMDEEPKEEVRKQAAAAYAKYQRISDTAALRLFSNNW